MKKLASVIICLIYLYIPYAQNEFIVNTFMNFAQRDPQIAQDTNGNYVVVWNSESQVSSISEGDIYLQLFDVTDQKIGSEIPVNSVTDGDQEKPAVAMNGDGNFVVVWASRTNLQNNYDIYGQLFKNNQTYGNNFLINTTTEHAQTQPDVTMDAAGNFVVVWDSWFQDGSDRGIYAQRFDADGNKVGSEFLVNTTIAYSQARPTVEYADNGEFIVIWESWKQDIVTPSGYGIVGQRLDANGNKIDGEFQINTYTNDFQWYGDIEIFEDGSFVVTWCSWEQDGSDGGVYLQRFDTDANEIGSEIAVNSSTAYYQWLPRLAQFPDNRFAVVWGSWKQDGSKEGVYAKIYDRSGREKSLETRINLTTENFQWEPVVIGTGENELVVVWSSWGQVEEDKDYEVVARRVKLDSPFINPKNVTAIAGRTTTEFIVHVLDSSATTGDTYQITFEIGDSIAPAMNVLNLNSAQTVVSNFELGLGEGILYLTPVFEGVALEVKPILELDVDSEKSYFINNTGSNLSFDVQASSNFRNIAPTDMALIWGSTDTLPDGRYATPLDTAFSSAGAFEVEVPFYAWDLIEDQQADLWVLENTKTFNQRWDPEETIRILTPDPYSTFIADSHAEIDVQLPAGNIILPGIGDTIFVLTKRPLTPEDTIQFQTKKEDILSSLDKNLYRLPERFELEQNYPNPFNPTTTIVFTVPKSGKLSLIVYNILGQEVTTLVDEYRQKGRHKVLLDARSLASGIYFYTLWQDNRSISRKMVLLK
jgi:hypothetical protein